MYTVTNTVTNTNTNLISKNNVHTDITKEIHVEKKRKKLNVPTCISCLKIKIQKMLIYTLKI